jgi:hypothetical protein
MPNEPQLALRQADQARTAVIETELEAIKAPLARYHTLGEAPEHISWLHDTGERGRTACGRDIEIWALDHLDFVCVLCWF